MEKYRDVIRGGKNYVIRDGENNARSIAKAVYGHERYEVYVPGLHIYHTGSVLMLPYLNLERPDHPEFVERQVLLYENLDAIKNLLKPYNLVDHESIPLMRMVYDAAQQTLYKRKT
jgi:hypothetical protein